MRQVLLCLAGLIATAAVVAAQEHSYTQADIENGSRLYQSSCAGCHGPGGDLVPGIDLLRNQFRRATNDVEIIRIVREGIAGTTMPPSSFSATEAGAIVAFLRSAAPSGPGAGFGPPGGRGGRAIVPPGDMAKGRALFAGKGPGATCHRVNGVGPRLAPELTDIGTIRQPADLQEKILDPSKNVRPANRSVEIVMKDGSKISGHLLNQDTFTIQVLDTRERLVSVSRGDVRDVAFVKESPMPSSRGKLTADEVNDLVAYLISLKGLRP
jgi:putative heme-binding domain-containing protein